MNCIEGIWRCVSSTFSGIPTHKKVVDSFKLELTSDLYRMFREDKLLYEGTYTLDDTTNPKLMTIFPVEREDRLFTILGLYELDEDTLTLCLMPGGQERPTSLTSAFGSSSDLKVWKRGISGLSA